MAEILSSPARIVHIGYRAGPVPSMILIKIYYIFFGVFIFRFRNYILEIWNFVIFPSYIDVCVMLITHYNARSMPTPDRLLKLFGTAAVWLAWKLAARPTRCLWARSITIEQIYPGKRAWPAECC